MTSHVAAVARSRAVMLAIGVGILTSLAVAAPSYADSPNVGSACQASGKINGRGATFQTDAQQLALIPGYRLDVCGPVNDANGNDMVFYNYAPGSNGLTGSGAGINAAKCRSDAFGGTDVPYTKQDLADTRVAPGAMPAAVLAACAALSDGVAPDLTPLYQPTPGPWPNAADTLATFTPAGAQARTGVMSFPVAGASVAMGINLTAANCPGLTANPTINLTSSQASRIFGGLITAWNDPALTTTSPDLASCPVAITRVVRLDKSGTTQTFKNYLAKADGATVLCDGVNTWTLLKTDANNTVWPENPPANGCVVNQLVRGATSGAPAVVTKVQTTTGAVGYADLADWTGTGLVLANVAPATAPSGPTFLSPAAGSAANCTFAGATAPGTTPSDSVGLNPNTNIGWASDAVPNKSDITFIGDGYPICGFTWDMVYVGLNHNNLANATAISRLNDNQRRTLYSYFSYVFTPYAQDRLAQNKYSKLPDALLAKFRAGFQQYF